MLRIMTVLSRCVGQTTCKAPLNRLPLNAERIHRADLSARQYTAHCEELVTRAYP
jgi:hypothetical protein